MSLAVAASVAAETVTVCDVDAVNTSFPGFCELMGVLGMSVTATPDEVR
jgi:5-enolpyruvylshikimate-3-phosphate synthase